jgi:ABC-type phosphate transport system permease subunit
MILRIDRLAIELPAPKHPSPNSASAVQELLGGKFGEMSTLMNYTFQSFNFRGRDRLRPFYDLIANIAAEEYGHIELVSHTINMLLSGSTTQGSDPSKTPLEDATDARNHYHFIASGQSALPVDSMGNPWNGTYVFSSGNLKLDLLHNFFLECGARANKIRVYEMVDDPVAREMVGYLLVRIVVGTSIGALAGYVGGWLDNILMRLMDIVLAFPSLLLAIAIVTAIGSSLINALFAIGIVSVPIYARVARASVLATKETDYVTASRALGESGAGILLRRIMPNSLTPLIVQGTLGIGGAVLEIAALAFVGVAGDISNPEWGSIIGLERNQLFNAPHIILAPGLAITLTVLGFNLLGDGLRDALDPRLNR